MLARSSRDPVALTTKVRLSDAQPRKFAPPSKGGFTDPVCETLQFVIVFVDDPRPTLLSLNPRQP